jgi:hypothetical protein
VSGVSADRLGIVPEGTAPDGTAPEGPVPEGTVLARIGPFPVEWGKAREIALALFDEDTAERLRPELGGRQPRVMPIYTMVQSLWGSALHDYAALQLDPDRLLDGEYDYEFHDDVRIGDWLTGVSRLQSRVASHGRRAGAFERITIETVFTNQRGERVVTMRRTVLQLEAAPSGEGYG